MRQRLNAAHSNTLSLQHHRSSAARSLAISHQTPQHRSLRNSHYLDEHLHQKKQHPSLYFTATTTTNNITTIAILHIIISPLFDGFIFTHIIPIPVFTLITPAIQLTRLSQTIIDSLHINNILSLSQGSLWKGSGHVVGGVYPRGAE